MALDDTRGQTLRIKPVTAGLVRLARSGREYLSRWSPFTRFRCGLCSGQLEFRQTHVVCEACNTPADLAPFKLRHPVQG